MGRGALPGTPDFLHAYVVHAASVRALFADAPGRLLVLDVDGDRLEAMRRFCAFVDPRLLRRPECKRPFPWRRLNCARRDQRDDAVCDDARGRERGTRPAPRAPLPPAAAPA